MTSVVGCIAEDLSPEDNELTILKYLGVASNGLKFMQDLCVCVCVCVCYVCVCAPIVGECCWLYSGRFIL